MSSDNGPRTYSDSHQLHASAALTILIIIIAHTDTQEIQHS